MKRKIIKQKDSYTITLPIEWIREFGLKEKDEVYMDFEDNIVVISTDKLKKTETKIKIITTAETAIRSIITNAYRLGYDKVEIEFENEEVYKIIEGITKRHLFGYEVMRKEDNKCVVEAIADLSKKNFDSIILKLFYAIQELLGIASNKLNNKRSTLDLEEIEDKIKMYDNMCRRIITKKGPITKRTYLLWSFLSLLIHSQRSIYYFTKNLKSKRYSKELKQIFLTAKQMLEYIIDAYKYKNLELIEKINEIQESFNLIEDEAKKLNKEEAILAYFLFYTRRNAYLAGSPLIGLII